MWTVNFQMFSWIQKRQRNQRSNWQHLLDHQKSQRVPEKHLLLLYFLCQSLCCVDHNKLWKFFPEMGIPDHLTCLLRNLYAVQEATVRTGHGTTDWFQIGKEYVKAVYCHPAYLAYMQSTSCKMLGWMKHRLESRLLGEISITSDMPMISPYGRKWRIKAPLDESERGEWKSWLNIQKTKSMTSGPITSWQINGDTMEPGRDPILGGSKNTADGDCSHEIKGSCPLEGKLWPT